MYLFKTSGRTFQGVIENEKHAFKNQPRHWERGELVLISKLKKDTHSWEKQIQYVTRIDDIRPIESGEATQYWGSQNEGRWRWIVDLYETVELSEPFDLWDIIGDKARKYWPVQSFKRIEPDDEVLIGNYL